MSPEYTGPQKRRFGKDNEYMAEFFGSYVNVYGKGAQPGKTGRPGRSTRRRPKLSPQARMHFNIMCETAEEYRALLEIEAGEPIKGMPVFDPHKYAELRAKYTMGMGSDIRRLQEVQTSMLPERVPQIPGFDIGFDYQSAGDVSGDVFGLWPVDSRNLGVYVADVSGKGVGASMLTGIIAATMPLLIAGEHSSKKTAAKVNNQVKKFRGRSDFVTMLYGVLDCASPEPTFSFTNAGHDPPILTRRGGSTQRGSKKGMALGLSASSSRGEEGLFERKVKEHVIIMNPGDRITVYTDGVTEAMNREEQEFGVERLLERVTELDRELSAGPSNPMSSMIFAKTLKTDVLKYQGDMPQHDDITVLTIKYTRERKPKK